MLPMTFNRLGFGPDIIKWIKLYNSNIKATVLQAGFLSELINIERRCKQGDPIAPDLFIICAHILFILIHNTKGINGVKDGSDE